MNDENQRLIRESLGISFNKRNVMNEGRFSDFTSKAGDFASRATDSAAGAITGKSISSRDIAKQVQDQARDIDAGKLINDVKGDIKDTLSQFNVKPEPRLIDTIIGIVTNKHGENVWRDLGMVSAVAIAVGAGVASLIGLSVVTLGYFKRNRERGEQVRQLIGEVTPNLLRDIDTLGILLKRDASIIERNSTMASVKRIHQDIMTAKQHTHRINTGFEIRVVKDARELLDVLEVRILKAQQAVARM